MTHIDHYDGSLEDGNNLSNKKTNGRRCYNCKFFATQDEGYSNYTVENTSIYCLKKHFGMTYESYSWRDSNDSTKDHEFFKQGETCPDFIQETGTQAGFDVEGEVTNDYFKSDPDVYNALIEYDK